MTNREAAESVAARVEVFDDGETKELVKAACYALQVLNVHPEHYAVWDRLSEAVEVFVDGDPDDLGLYGEQDAEA